MVELRSRYREAPRSKAAGWSKGVGAFSAVLLITVVIGHRQGLVETVAFFWVLAIVALLAAIALLLAGLASGRLWKYGGEGAKDVAFGTLLALVVLSPFFVVAYKLATYPMLKDVSTDLDDPPALTLASSLRTSSMNRIEPTTPGERRMQADAYPLVAGRRYDLPIDRVLDSVRTILARQGWQVVTPAIDAPVDGEITIEAVATTLILALPSDIAIRLVEDDGSTYVDMRSASRYGRHDLGDNAQRITEFLGELDQHVASQAGAMPAE